MEKQYVGLILMTPDNLESASKLLSCHISFINVNMQECFQERSFYFWRHGLYGHVMSICETGINSRNSNLILFLYHGLALSKIDKLEFSLKEIDKLKARKDLILIYNTALYFVHKYSPNPDQELVKELYKSIMETDTSKNLFTASNSAQIAIMFNDYKLAEFLLRKSPKTSYVQALQGWMLLDNGQPQKAIDVFLEISKDPAHSYDLLPLYGKACALIKLGRFNDAFQVHSQIISKYDFPEVLIDKARTNQFLANWDLSINVISGVKFCSDLEPGIIEGIGDIISKDNFSKALVAVQKIIDAAESTEKFNYKLLRDVALVFATIGSHNVSFIDTTVKLAKMAVEYKDSDSMSMAVLGYHHMLARNFVSAIPSFQKALERDPQNTFAQLSLIQALIEIGRYSEAQDQLDMCFMEDKDSLEIAVLQSRIDRLTGSSSSDIDSIIDELEKSIVACPLYKESKLSFDPDHLIQILTRLRLDVISAALDEIFFYRHSLADSQLDSRTARIIEFLTKLETIVPHFQPARFARGLILKQSGKVDEAISVFQKMLLSRWIYRKEYVLMYIAGLFYLNGDVDEAREYFEEAGHTNQEIMNTLDYEMLDLRLNSNKNKTIEKVFQVLMREKRDFIQYTDFIDLCFEMNEFDIPMTVLKTASTIASSAIDKSMLCTRQAILLASKKNFSKAEAVLEKIKKHKKLADLGYSASAEICIRFKKDVKGYIQCFKDLLVFDETNKHKELMGDAYKRVLDFDNAAIMYQSAIDPKTPDVGLLKKLVLVLVSAHRFDDAAQIFSRSIGYLRGNVAVPLALIKVLVTLKRYQEAIMCINTAMRLIGMNQSIAHSEIFEQRGIIMMKQGNVQDADTNLREALKRLSETIDPEVSNKYVIGLKKRAANICILIGNNSQKMNKRGISTEFYQKALQYDDSNSAAVTALFNIYKSRQDDQRCSAICIQFLEKYPKNETVILLYSSINNKDYPAIKYLEGHLNEHPKAYRTLVRLIELYARAGRLNSAKARIEMMANDDAPGMCFSKALYYWYMSNNSEAMALLEKSALSNRWRTASQRLMFQILTNPAKTFVWMQEGPLSDQVSLTKAQHILNKMSLSDHDRSLMTAELISATNTDEAVEEALSIVNNVVEKEKWTVDSKVALARYLLRLGKKKEAEENLAFMINVSPFHESFSIYEEAYLINAFIGAPETAASAIHRFLFLAIDLNKSSRVAREMNGKIKLQAKQYQEAMVSFAKCWELSGMKDFEAGYNYAYSAMKSKKPDIALTVARHILDVNPSYGDMKEKIVIPSYKMMMQR